MDNITIEKVLKEQNISYSQELLDNQKIEYIVNGWTIQVENDICKYVSETCEEGYVLEEKEQLEDLLKVYKEDDRCVEACMIKNKNYTQDTALKTMEYLNLRDHYASILRQYDTMKIIDKIEWKLEPDTERHFIYVYTNLGVPVFYDNQMNKIMNIYFENLKTECNCIGIKSTDFQPLAYNWS